MNKYRSIHQLLGISLLTLSLSFTFATEPVQAESGETFASGVQGAKEDFKSLGRRIKGFFKDVPAPFASESSSQVPRRSDGVSETDLASGTSSPEPRASKPSPMAPLEGSAAIGGSLDEVGNDSGEDDVVF